MINLKEISDVVKKSAPILATVISESNPLAGGIIQLLSYVFNNGNSENLAQAISSHSDAAIKLKQIEIDHSELIYQTEVDDRKNARQRQEEIVKITGKNDSVLHFLAISYISGFFGYVSLIFFSPPNFDKGVFHDLLNVAMLIFSFYFGSSYKQSK